MSRPQTARQLDLAFAQKVLDTPTRLLAGMVRGSDRLESQYAAVRQLEGRTALQGRILLVLATEGPLTARELESRTEFRGYGFSTVRKRISELKQSGMVVQVGRKDRMAQWDLR